MVISYVWVLETSTGATWRTGYLRLSGTIIGAIYAYLSWLIARTNPYGLTALITVADVPVTWIILKTTVQPLGVVINVTLGPITFAEYIQRHPDVSILCKCLDALSVIVDQVVAPGLATLRGLMIIGGIASAIIVVRNSFDLSDSRAEAPQNHTFYPRHCRVRSVFVRQYFWTKLSVGPIFNWYIPYPFFIEPTVPHHGQVRAIPHLLSL